LNTATSLNKTVATEPAFSRKQMAVAIYAAVVSFLTYASVYAYRKPFTVLTFEGLKFWGIEYQTLLIISQGLGYMASKFYGIRFISELKRIGRWKTAAILIGIAWLCLLLFAVVPAPYGMLCMFFNGFMLGFLWGIVFSYVEGRRATDFIGSAMAVSFIFAGGFTRSVALWLRDSWHVQDKWLPFTTGLVFALPLIILMYLLEKVPKPDAADEQERTVRAPMTRQERKNFLKKFGWGTIAILVTYLFLTIMRDIRDNFMANIWSELGYGSKPAIFTQTETITTLVVLVMVSLLVVIRKNIRAFRLIHWVVVAGFVVAGVSSALFLTGNMNGAIWMQLVGLGLYMGYIPFNCIFFERLIAAFKIVGNVGFLIYLVDAYGYLGSSFVMLSKGIFQVNLTWSQFYPAGVVVFSVIGLTATIFSLRYFNRKYQSLNS
jgi:MFS family permease